MALCRTSVSVLKYIKPVLVNSCFLTPGSVNMQVRYAARKGYREKVRMAKKEQTKASPVVTKEFNRLRRKVTKCEKTINLKKPDPPADDVIIRENFNYMKYSLSDAVKLHREYHHPTVYNNPDAVVNLTIEVNMTGKKETQIIKPFSSVVSIPHPFTVSCKREVLVFCSSDNVSLAMSCGASVAGGEELIKKIKEGAIQPSLYDFIIAHIDILPQLITIRNILKNQMPKAKQGTLTNDLKSAIYRFLHGIEYSCLQLGASKSTGFINCTVGLISMELDQLEENMKALIEDIEKNKPPRGGEFISWIWCSSPPSNEEFSIDLSKYIVTEEESLDDDDDDDDHHHRDKEDLAEKKARMALKQEAEEKELISEKL